jgi:hypothetical protein
MDQDFEEHKQRLNAMLTMDAKDIKVAGSDLPEAMIASAHVEADCIVSQLMSYAISGEWLIPYDPVRKPATLSFPDFFAEALENIPTALYNPAIARIHVRLRSAGIILSFATKTMSKFVLLKD